MHTNTKNSLFLLLIFIFSSQCFAALSENELIDQLRSDYRVLQQAKGDLDRANNGNKASTEALDLENWIRQLSDQLAEDCRQLSILSATATPADLPCEELLFSNPAPAHIDLTAESTQRQKTKQLEDQLNGSLGEFDERLLREQDRIKTRAPRTESTAGAGSGSSGGASESESAGASGSAADESGTGSKGSQKDKRDSGAKDEDDRTASNEKGTPGRPSSKPRSSAPADIPDGGDDDVIARQIREAAEKETDPELKKKLWDEYRRYRDAIK